MKSPQEYKKLQEQYNSIEREAKAMKETEMGYYAHIKALQKIIFQVKALQWKYRILTSSGNDFGGRFFKR